MPHVISLPGLAFPFGRFLLLCSAFVPCLSSIAFAQHFEVTPLAGYRFGGSVELRQEGQTSGQRVLLGDSGSYGFSAGVRFDELSLIEFCWMRAKPKLSLGDVSPLPVTFSQALTMDLFHGNFTREYQPEEQPWLRPFLTGSVGLARLSSAGNSFSRFSFGLGTGLNLFPRQRVGFRLEVQWLPIWVEPEVKGFVCGGTIGCTVVLSGKLVQQGVVSLGPVFRF
jgi:hypothetical protein